MCLFSLSEKLFLKRPSMKRSDDADSKGVTTMEWSLGGEADDFCLGIPMKPE